MPAFACFLPAAAFAALALPAAAHATATATQNGTTLAIVADGGDDTIEIAGTGTDVVVDLNGDGTADATVAQAAITQVTVATGGGADRVTALGNLAGEAFTYDGGPGDDVLLGTNGPDTIDGGDGQDVIDGQQGNDTVRGGNGADHVEWDPGDASDTIDGGPGDDALDFDASNAGEIVTLDPLPTPGHVRLFRNVASVSLDLVGIERADVMLLGGADSFTGAAGVAERLPFASIHGGAGLDAITGGDEADTINGGSAEVETLNGGGGDDRFTATAADAGAAADVIDGDGGIDTLAVAGSDAAETWSVTSPGAGQVVINELAAGLAWPATVEAAAIDALGGDDALTVAAAGVRVDARGGDGDDTFTGGDLADRLDGGAGRDRLTGGPGDDLLSGGAGEDVLTGASGRDTFSCGAPGDVLDATPEDTVGADCLAVAPPVVGEPAPKVVTVPGPTVVVPGPAGDDVAPKVNVLGLPGTVKRAALLKSGLSFRVRVDERAGVEALAIGAARAARIAAVADLTLARRALPLAAAGTRRVTLKPSRKLVGSAKRFTLTVRVVATDAAGNARTVTRKVKVR